MSLIREKFGVEFNVFVGTSKRLELTIINPDTNEATDLSDTDIYRTAIAKIYKPDGTPIGTDMNVNYTDRENGIVSFVITSARHTTLENAGNWIGEIEFISANTLVIDQQKFNLNIIESY